MVENKDFKRLVRRRMEKTGESYTTARAQLLKQGPAAYPPLPPEYETLAGVSNIALRAKTGRDWPEWVRILDDVDAVSLSHREIARLLVEDHGMADWWSQTVTVGYERLRGLRDVGQRRGGGYDVNKSKTVHVPLDALYRAVDDPALRSRWLGDLSLAVTSVNEGRSIRMLLEDDTRLDAYFVAKSDAKSTITLQHRSLPDRATADRMRALWGERLERLAALLTET